jgi:hypothetical protein
VDVERDFWRGSFKKRDCVRWLTGLQHPTNLHWREFTRHRNAAGLRTGDIQTQSDLVTVREETIAKRFARLHMVCNSR